MKIRSYDRRGFLHPWLATVALYSTSVFAGPYMPAGDLTLRQDIQVLSAHGIISGPVMAWPLAWGPVLREIDAAEAVGLPPRVADALGRVTARAAWETRVGELTFDARAGIADNATRIRSYQDTPRGRGELSAGLNWTGDRLSTDINVQYVDSTRDDQEVRVDNSMIGAAIGNWSVSASTMQRWWGPGWDGSLILSNNARPIPSLVIDRVFTDAFDSKWLSWLGPWDLNVIFGQLEADRIVPDARFLGIRVDFRPIQSLEIGLSRTAQWCGAGRPCDLDTFLDLMIGRDNRGDDGINLQNEPGNQLAALDARWSPTGMSGALSIYGQFMAEDEAGGFPSRWTGLVGGSWSGHILNRWTATMFAEYAQTTSEFYKSQERYNYTYSHFIYNTGYRFRGKAIGHSADNDSTIASLGLVLVDSGETQWHALFRFGELNGGGDPDERNTLTPTPQDISSFDISYRRVFGFGAVDAGIGYEAIDDAVTGGSSSGSRLFLQWRTSY